METPDPPTASARRSIRWALVVPALAVLAAAGAVVLVARGDGASRGGDAAGASSSTTPEADPVQVASDAPTYATLAELVAASDAVVTGEVTAVEPGRWFGDETSDTSARMRSRLVTLRVDDVVRGDLDPSVGQVLVEEEGWLADGSPLVVDGAAPSALGDAGVWFLVDPGDDTTDAWIAVNAQGRYLTVGDGGGLRGASGDDPLVAQLSALTRDELLALVEALPASTP